MKTLSFTEKHMTVLLEVQDAVNELIYHLQKLNGGGEDAGIVRRLGGVEKVLRELSPVYDSGEEVGKESWFWTAGLDTEMSMDRRVEMRMGEYQLIIVRSYFHSLPISLSILRFLKYKTISVETSRISSR